jgi:hypothetical protein
VQNSGALKRLTSLRVAYNAVNGLGMYPKRQKQQYRKCNDIS